MGRARHEEFGASESDGERHLHSAFFERGGGVLEAWDLACIIVAPMHRCGA